MSSRVVSEVIRKTGTPIADGVGEGKVWLIVADLPSRRSRRHVKPEMRGREEAKIRHAVQLLSFVIENAIHQVRARAGQEHAQIFVALREVLHDPGVLENVIALIQEERFTAYAAVQEVFAAYKHELERSPLTRIRERVHDLIEIEQGLLDALVNPLSLVRKEEDAHQGKFDRVVVSKYLTPRLVLEMRGRRMKGIVTEHAGETSHGAILCRALSIPAVSDLKGICRIARESTRIALDGGSGEVVLSHGKHGGLRSYLTTKEDQFHEGNPSRLGENFKIFANVNLSEHARDALASGAAGVGLYRSELEFLAAGRFLSEKEQASKYRNLVMTMMGMPVTIRLLDFSSDKAASLKECAPDTVTFECDRPDFLLANPDILKQQAHAIAEVSSLGPVSVLYPMVRDADHFVRLKKAFEDAVEGVDISHVDHGAMYELPSACEDVDRLMELVDFGSIGTNDLVHHLFGTNREENGSSALVEYSDRSELWEILAQVASQARRLSRPLTVCGEMGSQLRYFKRFAELGISRVSVDIPIVAKMRLALKLPPNEEEEKFEEAVGEHMDRYTR